MITAGCRRDVRVWNEDGNQTQDQTSSQNTFRIRGKQWLLLEPEE
jgi:hypothetical protein